MHIKYVPKLLLKNAKMHQCQFTDLVDVLFTLINFTVWKNSLKNKEMIITIYNFDKGKDFPGKHI